MALLVAIVGGLLAIAVIFPQVTTEVPVLKPIVQKVRSLLKPGSDGKAATPLVALTTPSTNLTPAQLRFIEDHRRLQKLLSEALRQK
jgi:hypothetical protein